MTRPWAATETDLNVMRTLAADRSSSSTLQDLRATLGDRATVVRDSLWILETQGMVEVLESSSAGLLGVLTARGRAYLGRTGGSR
jgi:hypothetical protein